MCSVIVLYPSGHDFDMDYYLSRHMKTIDEYALLSQTPAPC